MPKIRVTPEQVEAAQLEVQAFESAGLRPDPLVRKLAMATPASAKREPGPRPHLTTTRGWHVPMALRAPMDVVTFNRLPRAIREALTNQPSGVAKALETEYQRACLAFGHGLIDKVEVNRGTDGKVNGIVFRSHTGEDASELRMYKVSGLESATDPSAEDTSETPR